MNLKAVIVVDADRRSSAVRAPLIVEIVVEVDLKSLIVTCPLTVERVADVERKLLAVVFPLRLIVVVVRPIVIEDEATEKYVAPRLLFWISKRFDPNAVPLSKMEIPPMVVDNVISGSVEVLYAVCKEPPLPPPAEVHDNMRLPLVVKTWLFAPSDVGQV